MPNKRAAGQKLVAIPMDVEFLAAIDKAMAEHHCTNRSDFVRQSVLEKLQRMGCDVSPWLAAAPTRIGKAGRPRKNASSDPKTPKPSSASSSSSKAGKAVDRLIAEVVAEVKQRRRRQEPRG